MSHQDVRAEVENAVDEALRTELPNRDLVYRGSIVPELNRDEFQDNSIEGQGIDIWHMRMDPDAIDDVSLATAVPDGLPGELERHEIVSVTGGLSDNLGTGVFFSQQPEELPLLLYLDRDRIPGRTLPVEYEYEWFNRHPGALAHVDTLSTGEVFVNGDLIGLVSQDFNEPPTVSVWRRNIRGRATSRTFSEEEETIAFAPEIDLDAALTGVASWFLEEGPRVPSIDSVLAAQEGFTRKTFVARREEDVENIEFWDEEEMAEALHGIALEAMDFSPDEYWTIVTSRGLGKQDEMLPPEWFKFAYDGDRIVRSIDNVPAELVGRMPRAEAV